MRSQFMRRLAEQRGVAMVTVLFIGMVMTVVVSSAAFVTVREIQSSADDQRGGKAQAYAEAGIDRMMQWMRSSSTGWRQITLSGCGYPSGAATSTPITFSGQLGTAVETGTYTVTLAPNDPSNSYCAAVTDGTVNTETPPPIDEPYEMAMTSTGTYLSSTKTLRQIVSIEAEDFPLGMSASTIDANGNAEIRNMSIVSNSTITGRNKINMTGPDYFYTKGDFYPSLTGATAAQAMPSSVHTTDKAYLNGGRQEHPPVCNTTADKVGTDSVWDGSSTGGTISSCSVSPFPPTSKFTAADFTRIVGSGAPPRLTADDHLYFKTIAQSSGIYCSISSTRTCSRQGTTVTDLPNTATSVTVNTNSITNSPNICVPTPCYVTAYIEFASGNPLTNTVNWNANIPNNCVRGMVVLFIKNGSISFGGSAQFSGAIFAEDGRVRTVGSPYIEGVVTANSIELRGSPIYAMTPCWLENLPGPFMGVTALRWSEVDR